jgi:hypothetical protein
MSRITYQDFDILFARTGNGGEYSAKCFGAGGDGESTFTLSQIVAAAPALNEPAANAEEENLVSRHFNVATTTNQQNYYLTRRFPPDFEDLKKLGGALFACVFKGSLRSAFDRRREQLRVSKTFLRLRLNLTSVPELAVLPWEFLFDAEFGHFYAQVPGTPVIRYLNVGQPIEDLPVDGALRMLVVIPSPDGAQPLKVEEEWQKLERALKPLTDSNVLTIERLEKATLPALQNKLLDNLQESPFHIFHFIGHGVFNRQTGRGYLLFEDENKAGRLISGEDLSVVLRDQGVRLAVINACEGAVSAQSNSYAGVAQTLCREGGIPAVLAMQFEITDSAAITFAQTFYTALTENFPVEHAVAEARKAIRIMPNEIEWATPVLYMRSNEGRILKDELPHPVVPKPAPGPIVPVSLTDHYAEVIDALRDGALVPFIGLDANLFGRASDAENWQPDKGLPGNLELSRYLSRALNYPLNDLPDLARIAQYSIASNRLGRLYEKISEIFADEQNKPTEMHLTLAAMAAKVSAPPANSDQPFLRTKDSLRRRFIVVTTGYDNLLESAYRQTVPDFHVISYTARGNQKGKFLHSRYVGSVPDNAPVYINSPNNYTGLADGNPVILKLPGIVESPDPRFAITEDDYFDYLTNRELTSLLPAIVTGKLKNSSHLFLGYSPISWNMRALLYRIWEDVRCYYGKSWAVLDKSQILDEFFWQVCNVTIVRSDLREYIEGLRARLQND